MVERMKNKALTKDDGRVLGFATAPHNLRLNASVIAAGILQRGWGRDRRIDQAHSFGEK
jgi:hypothetical protein